MLRSSLAELLAQHTTLRVGGPAAEWSAPQTEAELIAAVSGADAEGTPVLVLGGGSNLVVADSGFPGLVIHTGGVRGSTREDHPDRVELSVAAGEPWDALVATTVAAGLAGVEALSGIPGLVGATPVQNVGAYGQEVSQSIRRVRAWDRRQGEVVELEAAECGFGYRSSRFKADPDRYVVLGVTFGLKPSEQSMPVGYAELARRLALEVGQRAPLAAVREMVLELRRGKAMVLDPADHDTWSAGSFFTNPLLDSAALSGLPEAAPRYPQPDGRVKSSAAWLIEHAGFGRGYGSGLAKLSTRHTLAITNRGGATAAAVLDLAVEIRDGVERAYGIRLQPEPILIGLDWIP